MAGLFFFAAGPDNVFNLIKSLPPPSVGAKMDPEISRIPYKTLQNHDFCSERCHDEYYNKGFNQFIFFLGHPEYLKQIQFDKIIPQDYFFAAGPGSLLINLIKLNHIS